MATIAENLQILKDSTDAIKLAIIDKGGTIEGDISTWADVISSIQSGGNSLLFDTYTYTPGLITNKLNGGIIGDPNIFYDLETVLYTYQLSPDVRDFIIFLNCQLEEEGLYSNKNVRYFFTNLTDYYYKGIFPLITPESTFYARTTNRKETISLSVDLFGDYSDLGSYLDSFTVLVFGEQCYDYDLFTLSISGCSCFTKDTIISLSNGITKKVQDIHYNDELLVWNFDEGKFDKAKPIWIKKTEQTNYYYKVTLENNIVINLVGSNGKCHRLFNYDDQLFESATDLVGKQVSTLQGLSKVISVEKIEETCEYYNIITDYHMNCYANGILTSCRYNNLYPIVDMKFDKSQVKLEPRYKIHAEKFKPNPEILPKYIRGMRLDENTTISIEDMKSYISNLERLRKNIDDFEENQEMVESVEESNVGWIDPEGNVYGYRLYMPGQMNHITLADKICKKLGYKLQELGGYSKTLEDLGWCKFTDEFLLAVSDLTDRQEHKLAKFMSTNPKVKKRGTIKLGNIFSEPTNIENVKKMSKKDLTNKMRGHVNKKN